MSDNNLNQVNATNPEIPNQVSTNEKFFSPDTDIYNEKESLVITMDLPGVEKGSIKIEIDENNVLSVHAKTSYTNPGNPVFSEFESGDYYRAISLRDEFNRDAIKAQFEIGVLEITIPRKEEVKPKKIEISA